MDFALKVLNWDADTIVRLQLWDIAGIYEQWPSDFLRSITHLDQNFKDQKTIIYVRFNTPNVFESNITIKTLQHELVGQYVYWYSMPETVAVWINDLCVIQQLHLILSDGIN